MKIIITIAAIFLASFGYSQSKDSVKTKDTSYILQGKFQDFQLLFLAVKSPRDVTPNQQDALAAWIEKAKLVLTDKK